ncbi:MAG TPA: DNA-formamidopyrimidine glycosylase family protein [Chitinophagaceae bacterium]|nr:DNA-formamidopyrimidine glycosylase family protein [Chitinophagaceae bacterium]
MPELPDVEVFTRNLHKILAGKKLLKVKIINGKKLADSAAALNKALAGKTLKRVYRAGKEMRFEFSGGQLLGLHLMLTGDVFIFDKTNEHHSTIAELHFAGGTGMALTDRMKNAFIKLSPVDKEGVDAISPALNFRYLLEALKRKTSIKKLMTDQNVIRGIGNSYSDEILWQARISPYSVAAAIPPEKIKELAVLIKKVLKKEIAQIDKNFKGKVNGEVKSFLQIHTKDKTTSPTGAPIIIDKKGMMKTYYTKEQVLYK